MIDLRSPRWMDQGLCLGGGLGMGMGQHHQQQGLMNGCGGSGSSTDHDNAFVSFYSPSNVTRKASNEHYNRDHALSSSSQADTTTHGDNNSHTDEGYLSHSSTADGGYHSGGGGGYHSYHHPALSYAPSVKSDIATGELGCT
jgi:hypothetical protein